MVNILIFVNVNTLTIALLFMFKFLYAFVSLFKLITTVFKGTTIVKVVQLLSHWLYALIELV